MATPALWSPFRWLSPAGERARLQVFIFHRVLPQYDPLQPDEPDARRFAEVCAWLARWFHVLPLGEAVQRLRQGSLPAAAACITFDDGYADNHEVAQPLLKAHGLPATCFVSTAYIDGGRMWNDSVIEGVRRLPAGRFTGAELGLPDYDVGDAESRIAMYRDVLKRWKHLDPRRRGELSDELARRCGLDARSTLMLSRPQLRAMRDAGMDIGAHTMTHPILATLPEAEARDEIGGGRELLASWLGEAPSLFAYPNGVPRQDYSLRDVRLAQACGFDAAVSTAHGANLRATDPFQLRRFTPWDTQKMRFAARCALNLVQHDRQPLAKE
ncbi:polysaccharide deacetylase family protein [Roseateles cellulosilyticus]|uniref:Polysaccharide deacetylase family protein n=1 Tax=Pelomonas cellulosilytica TaxID=2906762 RepID=A0ABS8Y374_9BURK|nr:polysaccharide deacetylase family protein [Pelomonas sp. P8]MCE4557564.1 polysaccharide deacetylase family protein [Pelomonas sp. P8]